MTPEQRAALETITERTLTVEEVIAIDALLPDRQDVQIAALLSIGRVCCVSTLIGIGTILAVLAPTGGDFLNTLETMGAVDANIKWVLRLIERSNFDIGHPASRGQMLELANKVPALSTSLEKLLAVGERDNPVQVNAVSDALNIAEGRLTL